MYPLHLCINFHRKKKNNNNAYTVEALKNFDWERVMLEVEKKLPILLTLLKQIVP